MAHQHDHHDHSHAHGHAGHSHAPDSFGFAFAVGVALNTVFVVAELVFGYAANSLALISDAVHNFSDVIALLLAWAAGWLARKRPTDQHTYGYRRASILAALVNAGLLLVAVGGIAVEAIDRIRTPAAVAGWTVVLVAALGIVVNGGTALLFMRGRHGDLNIRGAYLHMAADAGGFARRGRRGLRDHADGMAVGRSGDQPVHRRGRARERLGSGAGQRQSRARRRAERHRTCGRERLSRPARGRDRGARSAHLGHEHQRNRADRASGASRRLSTMRSSTAYAQSSRTASTSIMPRCRSRRAATSANLRRRSWCRNRADDA